MRFFTCSAEALEFPDHSGGAVSQSLFAYVWASFLVTNSLVQSLPDQAAKPVNNYSDGLLVPEARHIPAIKDFDDSALVFNRGIGSLIAKATHRRLPFGDR